MSDSPNKNVNHIRLYSQESSPAPACLPSILCLCPDTPTTYLDAISLSMELILSSPVGTYLPVTNAVLSPGRVTSEVFGINKVYVTDDRRLRFKRNIYRTNGAQLVRSYLGGSPKQGNKLLHNQMHKTDKALLAAHTQGGKTPLETQISYATKSYQDLADDLARDAGMEVKARSIKLCRYELYREYELRTDFQDLLNSLAAAITRLFGEFEICKDLVGRKKRDTGEFISYILPVPGQAGLAKTYKSKIVLKVYRKGRQIRAEVAFVDFPMAPTQRTGKDYPFTTALEKLHPIASAMNTEGTRILDLLHEALRKGPTLASGTRIASIMKDRFKIRGVDTDKRISVFIEALEKEGSYTPADHGQLRLSAEVLRKLKHPQHGLIKAVAVQGAAKNKKMTYVLREEWESAGSNSAATGTMEDCP